MKRRVFLEWINRDVAYRLFEARLKRAREKNGPNAVSDQTEGHLWDWGEMEEALQSQEFPSVEKAKKFVLSHPDLDMFNAPRIAIQEPCEDDNGEPRTIIELQHQADGSWRNTHTGAIHND